MAREQLEQPPMAEITRTIPADHAHLSSPVTQAATAHGRAAEARPTWMVRWLSVSRPGRCVRGSSAGPHRSRPAAWPQVRRPDHR